jgi:adenine phosphoribosyltransferase
MSMSIETRIKTALRPIPDYPKLGTTFYDSVQVFRNGALLKEVIRAMAAPFEGKGITHVVGVEPQGQILGGAIAFALEAGFISARKPRKLPWVQVRQVYSLEYGGDSLEARRDDFTESDRVIVVDDLLSSGGTAEAAAELVRALRGTLAGYSFILETVADGGRGKLVDAPVHVLLKI